MRRLEYEYFVASKLASKKRKLDKERAEEMSIPSSSSFDSTPERFDRKRCNSFSFFFQNAKTKPQNHRQELLEWAYNHGNIWAKTFSHSHQVSSSSIPSNLQIKSDFLQKNQNELCRLDFSQFFLTFLDFS